MGIFIILINIFLILFLSFKIWTIQKFESAQGIKQKAFIGLCINNISHFKLAMNMEITYKAAVIALKAMLCVIDSCLLLYLGLDDHDDLLHHNIADIITTICFDEQLVMCNKLFKMKHTPVVTSVILVQERNHKRQELL